MKSRFADQTNKIEEVFTMKKDKDISSLEHTSWRCQYHVVFAPKYRRMEIYGEIKQDIGIIIAQTMPTKGSGDYRGTGLPGSYPYADKHTTEVQCVANHGIPEREK